MSMKPEGRNPKAEGRPKSEVRTSFALSPVSSGSSDFGCRPSFGFRPSGFGFGRSRAAGFTLIELILVMAILTMAVSLTAPTLANFFRGRTLDSEARRLLAMTRSGQNRAVSEGIPMDLWVDSTQGIIGLDAEPSFEATDARAVQFNLDSGIQIEVVRNTLVAPTKMTLSPVQAVSIASVPRVNLTHSALPTIRFLPDGTVSESSPQMLRLTGRDGLSLWVALAQDRMNYEIRRTDK
jgi:prepilin-type N-terminal cleavage/methylation domain-containing protein